MTTTQAYKCPHCGLVEEGSQRQQGCKPETMAKVTAYQCDHCGRLFEEPQPTTSPHLCKECTTK